MKSNKLFLSLQRFLVDETVLLVTPQVMYLSGVNDHVLHLVTAVSTLEANVRLFLAMHLQMLLHLVPSVKDFGAQVTGPVFGSTRPL